MGSPTTRVTAAASLCALLLAGCGTASAPPAGTSSPETGRTDPGGLARPADLRVRGGDGWVDVAPHTWCLGDGCVDGVLPDPLPELGTTDGPVLLDIPAGWTVFQTWSPVGADCGPGLAGPTVTSDGSPVELEPLGAAGDWQLDLFVRPAGGGDAVAAVQVTTTVDHPLPEPELRLTSFFDHDGQVVQYGPVELDGAYLPPDLLDDGAPVATLTVRSADGRTSTIDLAPSDRVEDCEEPGRLFLREPGRGTGPSEHAVGEDLGAPPYDLTLELRLAGTTHTGHATWPDDVDDEDSAIHLEVRPALPRPEPGELLRIHPAHR